MKTHKNIIVTLMYNKWELTRQLIDGLLEHEKENINELLVIDNGSKIIEKASLRESFLGVDLGFRATVKEIPENLGFTLGANVGLKTACDENSKADIVFLISNDVQIKGKFIEQAEEKLQNEIPALVGNRHIYWDSGWNKFKGKVYGYLEGYFLAAKISTWEYLNFFDPAYAPCDFEDVDLSTKAKIGSISLSSLENPNIVHLGAQTLGYNPEREAITKRNQKYFEAKWAE